MFRFFSAGTDLEAAARLMADVDYSRMYGLIAVRGANDEVVAQGNYFTGRPQRPRSHSQSPRDLQGFGLGTLLLAHLAEVAQDNGISVFTAEVMPDNHRMIEVFRESGFPVETSSQPGSIHVELPTSFSDESIRRFEERDRLAAQAAIRPFLEPRAVAVIGASRKHGTVGGQLFHNALESGFEGVVYPVNPSADVVQSVRAYPNVADVPDDVDLAVIAVPAPAVIEVARECGSSGIPAVVVISAGFAETGPAGAELQRELVEVCRAAGMRLVGPNCLGILNTAEHSQLNVTFAPGSPPRGHVGFASQSGALGLALIDLASERGIGVSSFASIGNRADITANDFLEYWETDDATRVALLYIESFTDPRRFSRVARRLGREMPIVVVKSGRSAAGERATSSHTGALLAASDVTVDALFDQAGVIRTDSLAELLDVASLLENQPLPGGPRVGIVTNAGGPGIMCADACEAADLEVPEIPELSETGSLSTCRPRLGLLNPVDMIATATAEHYRTTIRTLSEWDGIDALIVIFIRPLLTRAEDVAEAIRSAVQEMSREIPVQAVFMSAQDQGGMAASGVPTYQYPEDAARTLGQVMRHVAWRSRPAQEPPEFNDVRTEEAAAVIANALRSGREWVGFDETARLLECYGVAIPEWRLAPSPEQAGQAAEEFGGQVVLKAQGPGLLHKTEMGAVRIGLTGNAEVTRAAEEMDEAIARAGAERQDFIVQAMVDSGVELLVGVVHDATFGPVLACGAGGTQAELLKDVSVRICPITAGRGERDAPLSRDLPAAYRVSRRSRVDLDRSTSFFFA